MTTIIIILFLCAVGVLAFLAYEDKHAPIIEDAPDATTTHDDADDDSVAPDITDESTETHDGETVTDERPHSATHGLHEVLANNVTGTPVIIGTYDYPEVGRFWSCRGAATDIDSGIETFTDIMFRDGYIFGVFRRVVNNDTTLTTRYITHYDDGVCAYDDFFDVKVAAFATNAYYDRIMSYFGVTLPVGTKIEMFAKSLVAEAVAQYNGMTKCNLPLLMREDLFPTIYDYRKGARPVVDDVACMDAMCGWVIGSLLTETFPERRNYFTTVAYMMAGGADASMFGNAFDGDPYVLIRVASSVYSAMRGLYVDDFDVLRKEVGGSCYTLTLHDVEEASFADLSASFYIDYTMMMPPTPGAYLPTYADRSRVGGYPFPNDMTDASHNTDVDVETYRRVVDGYTMDETCRNIQRMIQAIADKEGGAQHLFGDDRQVGTYHFRPVFGVDNIGARIADDGAAAAMANDLFIAALTSRKSLLNNGRYGRVRPGQDANIDGLSKPWPQGVAIDYSIENADGVPASYYDKDGNLVVGRQCNPKDYEDYYRHQVYANSYPSGHSAGAWAVAQMLTELMPERADKILRAANDYALSRVICRYHWLSDTLIGQAVGASCMSVLRATSDYDARMKDAQQEIRGLT